MATRERYVRIAVGLPGEMEICPGLEWRDDDQPEDLRVALERLVLLELVKGDSREPWSRTALRIESAMRERWPDRAYFLEVGRDDRWVQIFQPFGLPRRTSGITE